MIKIAYDLDGVLIPDCDEFPNLGGLDQFYALTTYMRPIFYPQGEFAIITARPAEYRAVTMEWCNKYLWPKPSRLFHELTVETPGAYKAEVLNKNTDIQTYVESDEGIVKYLKCNVTTGCNIIHFSEFLEQHYMRE